MVSELVPGQVPGQAPAPGPGRPESKHECHYTCEWLEVFVSRGSERLAVTRCAPVFAVAAAAAFHNVSVRITAKSV